MTNEDSSAGGQEDRPMNAISTSTHTRGSSIGEWSKASQQDPATLASSQKKILTEALL